MLQSKHSQPTRDGGYLLQSYPGCTTLYHGDLEGESAYVVGRNTPDERLFKRADLAEATTWAIETRESLENIPLVALCAEAVTDLFAAV